MAMHYGDVMLGPGGEFRHPVSESDALTAAIQHITHGDYRDALNVLKALRSQVRHGYHRNPGGVYAPFRVAGVISHDVHSIAYTHAKDGKAYKHDFNRDTASALAVERHGKREILIAGEVPLWDEF